MTHGGPHMFPHGWIHPPTCITSVAVSPRAELELGGAPDGKLGPPVEKERLGDMMTLSRPLASG